MKRKTSVAIQRARESQSQKASIGLHCELLNLARDIKRGDATKLVSFQQMVQYAPTKMLEHVIHELETL